MFTCTKHFYHTFLRIQKAVILFVFLGLVYVIPALSTRQLLICITLGLTFFLYKYTIKQWMQHILYKKTGSDKITFNDALANEIFSIKHKVNELLIDKNERQKKIHDPIIQKDRKLFLEREYFYKDYARIVHQAFYRTANGEDGSIIIFKQKSKLKSEVRLLEYFSPLRMSELIGHHFGEEMLIQLHSSGPKKYKTIRKLNIGDKLVAEIYDPELGYCKSPLIKVVSIDKSHESYNNQDVIVEISSDSWSKNSKIVERTINLPIQFKEDRFS